MIDVPAPPARMTSVSSRVQPRGMPQAVPSGAHGVGLFFTASGQGSILIAELENGGPAFRAGVCKIGDELLKIDGTVVEKAPLAAVHDRISGQAGTNISLTLRRVHPDTSHLVYEVELVRGDAAFMEVASRNKALTRENSTLVAQMQEMKHHVFTLGEQMEQMKGQLLDKEKRVSDMMHDVQKFDAMG